MPPQHKSMIALLWLIVLLSLNPASTSRTSERELHSVEVTFYQLSKSEWSGSVPAFKALVAAEASSYCATHSECGLSAGFSFSASEVGIFSGPTEDSKSLKIHFYIDFPSVHILSASSSTTYVINFATTSTIMANVRTAAENILGCDITYIGKEFYSIDPDVQLNKILIPVAVAVLLLVTVLAIGLHVWRKEQEKEAERKLKVAGMKTRKNYMRVSPMRSVTKEDNHMRVSPMRSVTKEDNQNDKFMPRYPRKQKRVRQATAVKGQVSAQGSMPTLSVKSNAVTCDSGPAVVSLPNNLETVLTGDSRIAVRHNALPPLQVTPVVRDLSGKKRGTKERRRQRQHKQCPEDTREHEKEESPTEDSTIKEK